MYHIWFFDIGNDWGWSVEIPALPDGGGDPNSPPMTEAELIQFVAALAEKFGQNSVRLEKVTSTGTEVCELTAV